MRKQRSKKKKRHLRNKSKILGCGNFVCLLEKYELLKTFKNGEQNGFFLETQKVKLDKKSKKCKSFKCWVKKFTITKKTDGYLLKLNNKNTNNKAVNKNSNANDNENWDFHRPATYP